MAIVEVRMPQVSMGDNEGVLTEWLRQPGETVSADEPIATIETAKAQIDVVAPTAGVVTEQIVAVDAEVAAGDVIALIDSGND